MNKKIFLKIMFLVSTLFTFASAKELKVIAPWEMTGMEATQSGYIFSRMQAAETLVEVNKKR